MPQSPRETSRIVNMAAAAVVIAGLSLGSPILVPLALSILISFAVAPLVTRLERWHFGRVGSVMTVVLLGVALGAGTMLLVAGQAADLVAQLPEYRGNLSKKFEVVRNMDRKWASASGEFARASREPESAAKTEKDGAAAKAAAVQPAPPPEVRDFASLRDSAGKVIQWCLTVLGVVVLVGFILLQREDLHARALRLAGGGHYGVTSQALNEAAEKLSQYLLAQLSLNALYGAVIAIGLFFLGVPNAFLWGLLSGLLRFLPYIGPILAAALPIGLSLAISADWKLPLAVAAYFVVVEIVVNSIIEPLLFSRTTGLSAVAILAAAGFWTWLWGPVGLVLATPLTVCLFVLGKYFPPLHFFHVLMGKEVDKSLAARLYLRLLSADHEAVWEAVSEERRRSGLAEAFDETLVPALEMVKRNRLAGELDPDVARRMIRDIEEIVEEAADEAVASAETPSVPLGDVLCVPTRDEEDCASCRMLARVLGLEGIATRTILPDAVEASATQLSSPSVFCVIDVRPSSSRRVHHLARALRLRFPDVPIVAARLPSNLADNASPTAEAPSLHSASTIEECREVVKRLLGPGKAAAATAPRDDAALQVAGR